MLNRKQMSENLKQWTQELVEVKKIFRESGQPRLDVGHYRKRRQLKEHVTALCAISALFRGKLHLKSKTKEEHQKLIEPYIKYYTITEAA